MIYTPDKNYYKKQINISINKKIYKNTNKKEKKY